MLHVALCGMVHGYCAGSFIKNIFVIFKRPPVIDQFLNFSYIIVKYCSMYIVHTMYNTVVISMYTSCTVQYKRSSYSVP